MKSIKPLILLLAVFEFGCGTVPLPHTNLCVANPGAKTSKCYWVDSDYDDHGNLKPTAKPNYKPLITLDDINKAIWTDPDSWAEFKAYVRTLREELQTCGQAR